MMRPTATVPKLYALLACFVSLAGVSSLSLSKSKGGLVNRVPFQYQRHLNTICSPTQPSPSCPTYYKHKYRSLQNVVHCRTCRGQAYWRGSFDNNKPNTTQLMEPSTRRIRPILRLYLTASVMGTTCTLLCIRSGHNPQSKGYHSKENNCLQGQGQHNYQEGSAEEETCKEEGGCEEEGRAKEEEGCEEGPHGRAEAQGADCRSEDQGIVARGAQHWSQDGMECIVGTGNKGKEAKCNLRCKHAGCHV